MASLSYQSCGGPSERRLARFQNSGSDEEEYELQATMQAESFVCDEFSEHDLRYFQECVAEYAPIARSCDSREGLAVSRTQRHRDFHDEVTNTVAAIHPRRPRLQPNAARTASTWKDTGLTSVPSSFEEYISADIRGRAGEDMVQMVSIPEGSAINLPRGSQEELNYALSGMRGGGGLQTNGDSIRTPQQNIIPGSPRSPQAADHNVSFTNLQYRPKNAPSLEAAPGKHSLGVLERWISTDDPWNTVSTQNGRSVIPSAIESGYGGRFNSAQYSSAPCVEAYIDTRGFLGVEANSTDLTSHRIAHDLTVTRSACSQIVFQDLKNDENVRSHAHGAGDSLNTRKTSESGKKSAGASTSGNKHGLTGSSDGNQDSNKKRSGGQRQLKEWCLPEQYDEGEFACPFPKLDPIGHPRCHTFSRKKILDVKYHLVNTDHDSVDPILQNVLQNTKHPKASRETIWFHFFNLISQNVNVNDHRLPEHPWKENYMILAIKHYRQEVDRTFEAAMQTEMNRFTTLSGEKAQRIAIDVHGASSQTAMNVVSPIASNNLLAASHNTYGSSGQDSGFMSSEMSRIPDLSTQSVASPFKRAPDSMNLMTIMIDPPEPSESSNWTTDDQPDNPVFLEYNQTDDDDMNGDYIGLFPCDEAEPDDYYAEELENDDASELKGF